MKLHIAEKYEELTQKFNRQTDEAAIQLEQHQKQIDEGTSREILKLQNAEEQLRTAEGIERRLQAELEIAKGKLTELTESLLNSQSMVSFIFYFTFMIQVILKL